MFKIVAVIINVATGVCGPDTGQRCSATFEGGMIGTKSFRTLGECQKASGQAHELVVDRGMAFNTFCARFK